MNDERDLTIPEFCEKHNFSIPHYYKQRALGLGPRELRSGTKVSITPQADRDWVRARENPDSSEAKEIEQRASEMRKRAKRAAAASVASNKHVSRTASRIPLRKGKGETQREGCQ